MVRSGRTRTHRVSCTTRRQRYRDHCLRPPDARQDIETNRWSPEGIEYCYACRMNARFLHPRWRLVPQSVPRLWAGCLQFDRRPPRSARSVLRTTFIHARPRCVGEYGAETPVLLQATDRPVAMAVSPGDVGTPVPEPRSLPLVLAALGALSLFHRRDQLKQTTETNH